MTVERSKSQLLSAWVVLVMLLSLFGTACRTSEPSDAARIHARTSPELVAWLDWEQLPEDLKDRDPAFVGDVCRELVARRDVDFLLASFNSSTNDLVRKWLVRDVLYRIDDGRIYSEFARRMDDTETEESYYFALYLAERGNTAALATLNRHYFQYTAEGGSTGWIPAVEAFGKYKYRPAVSNLVESIEAANLFLGGASCSALQEIYSDSPRHFANPAEAQNYFLKRLSESANEPHR